MATPFGGGLAMSGGVCGVVAGALMAMGVLLGRSRPDESPKECYSRSRQFLEDFTARYGTLSCRELTGCDLSTRTGRKKMAAGKVKEKTCHGLLLWAADEIAPLLKASC